MKSAARFTAPAAVLLLALTGCSAGGDAHSPEASQNTATEAQSEESSSSPDTASATGDGDGKLNADGAWNTDEPFISTTNGLGESDIFPDGVRVGFVDEAPQFIKDGFKAAGMEVPSDAQFGYLETSGGQGLDKDIDDFTAYDGKGDYHDYDTIQSWFETTAEHSAAATPTTDPDEDPSDANRLLRDDAGIEATAGSGGTAKLYFVTDEKNLDWVEWVNINFRKQNGNSGTTRAQLNLIPGGVAIVPDNH